jgi:hypothetical protein
MLCTSSGTRQGTEEIVRAAGVRRGAPVPPVPRQGRPFRCRGRGGRGEIAGRIAEGAAGAADPVGAVRVGAQLFLEACAEPEVERIILPGAPAVLGWQAWRYLAGCYGLGLIQLALPSATDAGAIVPQPVVPLAHVLIGALGECVLCAARAGDPAAAREECAAIFDRILRSIAPDAGPAAWSASAPACLQSWPLPPGRALA